MRTRISVGSVAGIVALGLMLLVGHNASAAVGDAWSSSKGISGKTLSSFTTVGKLRLPKGSYSVTTTGTIRNNGASVGYLECFFQSNDVSLNSNGSEFVVPASLSPGVPGGGTWAITTTVVVPAGGGVVKVICGNFGPVLDSDVAAWFPNIVAIRLGTDHHKTGS